MDITNIFFLIFFTVIWPEGSRNWNKYDILKKIFQVTKKDWIGSNSNTTAQVIFLFYI